VETNKELETFLGEVDKRLAKGQENEAKLAKQLQDEAKAAREEMEGKVAQYNEDLAKQNLTIGEMKAKVDEFVAKQGKLGGAPEMGSNYRDIEGIFGKMIVDGTGALAKAFEKKHVNLETKVVGDMTTANNHTGNVAITQFNRPPLVFPQFRHMRSIINVVPSDTLAVDYPREKVPDGEGSFGPQTEGQDKAQVDIDTQMISLTLDFEAGYATVTRQMLMNVPWLQNYLTRKLTEKFYRREDVKVLNLLDSLATASASSATVVAEALIDMIAEVDSYGYAADGILTTPLHWAGIMKTKPVDYSVPGGVIISPTGEVLVAGLPLYKHQNVTTGKIYVGDFTALYIVQGGAFSIRTSEHHNDNFTKNKVTFLAEAPIGVALEAAQAFVKKTL